MVAVAQPIPQTPDSNIGSASSVASQTSSNTIVNEYSVNATATNATFNANASTSTSINSTLSTQAQQPTIATPLTPTATSKHSPKQKTETPAKTKKQKHVTPCSPESLASKTSGYGVSGADVNNVIEIFSKECASPERQYIRSVLRSKKFTLFVAPPDVPMAGKYIGQDNMLGIRIPDACTSREAMQDYIRHESWHARITQHNVGNDPEAALQGASEGELAAAQAPFTTQKQKQELKTALEAGIKRVHYFETLLQKQDQHRSLTSEEQEMLIKFKDATSNYNPFSYTYAVPKSIVRNLPGGRMAVLANNPPLFTLPSADGNQFTLYVTCITETAEAFELHGHLVPNALQNRARAFILDQANWYNIMGSSYASLGETGQTAELTERNAFIMQSPLITRRVFYPEMERYHARNYDYQPALEEVEENNLSP
jgi:hypothetical protein